MNDFPMINNRPWPYRNYHFFTYKITRCVNFCQGRFRNRKLHSCTDDISFRCLQFRFCFSRSRRRLFSPVVNYHGTTTRVSGRFSWLLDRPNDKKKRINNPFERTEPFPYRSAQYAENVRKITIEMRPVMIHFDGRHRVTYQRDTLLRAVI